MPPTPPVPQQDPDAPLRRDVKTLGYELGRTLRELGSPELFPLVEDVRTLAKQRREGNPDAEAQLTAKLQSLTEPQLEELVRALACYFDLANLAEDRHRLRVLDQREHDTAPNPRKQSLGDALHTLLQDGVTPETLTDRLAQLDIDLVLTAHPTEAKRRTIRNTLARLRRDLIDLDRPGLLPRQRQALIHRIQCDLACLWDTDPLRPNKPTVEEELERALFVLDSVWDLIPPLQRQTRQALPDDTPAPPLGLRFGCWIGGDRDGNPFVTPAVTAHALARLRSATVQHHLREARDLRRMLSLSSTFHPPSPDLQTRLDRWGTQMPELADHLTSINPHEQYRRYLTGVMARLHRSTRIDPAQPQPIPDAAYRSATELIDDLKLAQTSLRDDGHAILADGPLQDWIDRTHVFGLHFARLDIREDSRTLHQAIDELATTTRLHTTYTDLNEQDRAAFLATPPVLPQPLDHLTLSETAHKTLGLFELLEHAHTTLGPEALGCCIISMTHHPSDVLAVLWLARLATANLAIHKPDHKPTDAEGFRAAPRNTMPIVPLFETIDDLDYAPDTLAQLLACPPYADRLKTVNANRQTVMVGYSDSCKDGGYLASNAGLYHAQRALARTAKDHGIDLVLFHGRGGALGRGGGPAARSVLTLPPEAVNHRMRITEQGEVLADRYDDPDIALRHLEQVAWATLKVSHDAEGSHDVPAEWEDALQQAAAASRTAYRALRDDPAFLAYFDQATPINVIESLPIGSRPSRRRARVSLDDLRAIPYTFAWTQNRHLLTAWFGLGTGLNTLDPGLFKTMYADWPVFQGIIDNAELALAKSDMPIALRYAEQLDASLEDPEAGERLFARIEAEFWASRETVLAITGANDLLSRTPWLQRSIQVRNPYIDPLNLIQIELMRRGTDPASRLSRMTVQAIAAGLRTTG
ncbi:MAG: phosphoenolpyruvate carboxylase [Planctomycetota bacterium]